MPTAYLRRLACAAFVLATLTVASCDRSASTEKAKEAPRVTVAHPVSRSLTIEDDYNGWLEASQTVEVRARVRGHIQKVAFKDGDYVQKDQLLFQLDPRPFEVAIQETEAEAKSLDAQRIVAEKNVARLEVLRKANATSAAEYEEVVADAQSFAARVAAKKQLTERHKLDLEYSKITAPIAGRISRAMLTEGNLVNAGGSDPVLTTIVAVDPIYVDFNVDERAIQRYQEIGAAKPTKSEKVLLRDQKIPFSFGLDTETGFPHQGSIVFADNKCAAGTGTILVRGEAKNPDGRLIPGARVRVRIAVSDKSEAVVVPDTAVLSDQDQRYLLVLGKNDVVLRRDINPGRLLDDGMRIVLPERSAEKTASKSDSVKGWEKEWVITVGLQRARVNYPVQPTDEKGQPINAGGSSQ
jgi:membrane fusion protein, gold/copper resistance efflux system